MANDERCNPYCTGRDHEAGCLGIQAWDIPEACNCSRPKCQFCTAKKAALTRRLRAVAPASTDSPTTGGEA